jgi:hypothetical protein
VLFTDLKTPNGERWGAKGRPNHLVGDIA